MDRDRKRKQSEPSSGGRSSSRLRGRPAKHAKKDKDSDEENGRASTATPTEEAQVLVDLTSEIPPRTFEESVKDSKQLHNVVRAIPDLSTLYRTCHRILLRLKAEGDELDSVLRSSPEIGNIASSFFLLSMNCTRRAPPQEVFEILENIKETTPECGEEAVSELVNGFTVDPRLWPLFSILIQSVKRQIGDFPSSPQSVNLVQSIAKVVRMVFSLSMRKPKEEALPPNLNQIDQIGGSPFRLKTDDASPIASDKKIHQKVVENRSKLHSALSNIHQHADKLQEAKLMNQTKFSSVSELDKAFDDVFRAVNGGFGEGQKDIDQLNQKTQSEIKSRNLNNLSALYASCVKTYQNMTYSELQKEFLMKLLAAEVCTPRGSIRSDLHDMISHLQRFVDADVPPAVLDIPNAESEPETAQASFSKFLTDAKEDLSVTQCLFHLNEFAESAKNCLRSCLADNLAKLHERWQEGLGRVFESAFDCLATMCDVVQFMKRRFDFGEGDYRACIARKQELIELGYWEGDGMVTGPTVQVQQQLKFYENMATEHKLLIDDLNQCFKAILHRLETLTSNKDSVEALQKLSRNFDETYGTEKLSEKETDLVTQQDVCLFINRQAEALIECLTAWTIEPSEQAAQDVQMTGEAAEKQPAKLPLVPGSQSNVPKPMFSGAHFFRAVLGSEEHQALAAQANATSQPSSTEGGAVSAGESSSGPITPSFTPQLSLSITANPLSRPAVSVQPLLENCMHTVGSILGFLKSEESGAEVEESEILLRKTAIAALDYMAEKKGLTIEGIISAQKEADRRRQEEQEAEMRRKAEAEAAAAAEAERKRLEEEAAQKKKQQQEEEERLKRQEAEAAAAAAAEKEKQQQQEKTMEVETESTSPAMELSTESTTKESTNEPAAPTEVSDQQQQQQQMEQEEAVVVTEQTVSVVVEADSNGETITVTAVETKTVEGDDADSVTSETM